MAAVLAAGLAAPAPAGANIEAGTGNIEGTVTIGQPGIQSALSLNCNGISWGYSPSGVQLGVAATTGEGFVGGMAFSASGGTSSSCESIDVGVGTLNIGLATGVPLNGVFHMTASCVNMPGAYNRLGTIVLLTVRSASCEIDGTPEAVQAYAVGQLTPTSGDGVTSAITSANFSGVWAIADPNN